MRDPKEEDAQRADSCLRVLQIHGRPGCRVGSCESEVGVGNAAQDSQGEKGKEEITRAGTVRCGSKGPRNRLQPAFADWWSVVHHATLLRNTVQVLLEDHDVYITDWSDARQVSLAHGQFDLSDYTRSEEHTS